MFFHSHLALVAKLLREFASARDRQKKRDFFHSPLALVAKLLREFASARDRQKKRDFFHSPLALVAKLVDAPDLGSGDFGRVGSSPIRRTFSIRRKILLGFPPNCFL